ncbi:MAG: MCE family protein [Actinomycetota bacterium]|nr:MCE family protein [Actinomycetota bacterium]
MKRLVSALVLAVMVAAAIAAYSVARPEQEDTYTLTADIEEAPNLFDGARVMVRGVEVGVITRVEPKPDAVRVTMEIQEDVPVPAGAHLQVVPVTIIADRYVQLYPQYTSGAALQDGAHLSLARTSIPAELDDVLTQLRELLGALEPREGELAGPLRRLIAGLDSATRGRSDELAGTLSNSAVVLQNLAGSETDIRKLISNLDRLFLSLANRSSEIGLLNERFQLVVSSLARDQQELEGTIENVAFLSRQGSALVQESGDELGQAFARLDTVLHDVLRHRTALVNALKWTNVIAEAVGATDASGRGVHAYTGRQAPPGSPRSAYNYRIDSRDTISCRRLEVLAESFLLLFPDWGPDDITDTALSFIPPEYDIHLRFLIRQLVVLCAGHLFADGAGSFDAQAERSVRQLAKEIGQNEMKVLLARWYWSGFKNGSTR